MTDDAACGGDVVFEKPAGKSSAKTSWLKRCLSQPLKLLGGRGRKNRVVPIDEVVDSHLATEGAECCGGSCGSTAPPADDGIRALARTSSEPLDSGGEAYALVLYEGQESSGSPLGSKPAARSAETLEREAPPFSVSRPGAGLQAAAAAQDVSSNPIAPGPPSPGPAKSAPTSAADTRPIPKLPNLQRQRRPLLFPPDPVPEPPPLGMAFGAKVPEWQWSRAGLAPLPMELLEEDREEAGAQGPEHDDELPTATVDGMLPPLPTGPPVAEDVRPPSSPAPSPSVRKRGSPTHGTPSAADAAPKGESPSGKSAKPRPGPPVPEPEEMTAGLREALGLTAGSPDSSLPRQANKSYRQRDRSGIRGLIHASAAGGAPIIGKATARQAGVHHGHGMGGRATASGMKPGAISTGGSRPTTAGEASASNASWSAASSWRDEWTPSGELAAPRADPAITAKAMKARVALGRSEVPPQLPGLPPPKPAAPTRLPGAGQDGSDCTIDQLLAEVNSYASRSSAGEKNVQPPVPVDEAMKRLQKEAHLRHAMPPPLGRPVRRTPAHSPASSQGEWATSPPAQARGGDDQFADGLERKAVTPQTVPASASSEDLARGNQLKKMQASEAGFSDLAASFVSLDVFT
eukprot:TRINITY_DN32045_c0_g1_i1.p1 TRINITY_DN32045_c0_g1~~TRINITY_DN32045_c0_g1_i1.p1  ORF type:complete len:632 (-),score=116.08 TRINITY_DN32045_c0_g1_i1:206-2101(-)